MSNLLSQFKELVETPLQQKYKEYIQNAVTRSNEQLSQLAKQAAERMSVEIKQAGVETAQDFYGSYSPIVYDRRNSLFHVVQAYVNGGSITIHDDAVGALGNSYLANLVWELGYHGGAKSGVLAGVSYSGVKRGAVFGISHSGAPRWTTYPFITNPVRWGRMATKSPSPYNEQIKREDQIIDKNVVIFVDKAFRIIENNLR